MRFSSSVLDFRDEQMNPTVLLAFRYLAFSRYQVMKRSSTSLQLILRQQSVGDGRLEKKERCRSATASRESRMVKRNRRRCYFETSEQSAGGRASRLEKRYLRLSLFEKEMFLFLFRSIPMKTLLCTVESVQELGLHARNKVH